MTHQHDQTVSTKTKDSIYAIVTGSTEIHRAHITLELLQNIFLQLGPLGPSVPEGHCYFAPIRVRLTEWSAFRSRPLSLGKQFPPHQIHGLRVNASIMSFGSTGGP